MAGRKWDRKTIKKMQGLADEIRSGKTPPVHPHAWLGAQTGLCDRAIHRLASGRTTNGSSPEVKARKLHEDFAAAYDALSEACARPFVQVVETIALATGNTPADRMKAATWCAEVMFAKRYGKKSVDIEITTESQGDAQAADVDPAVWDEMNEEEGNRLAVILTRIEQDENARDNLIADVKKRVDASDMW